MSRSRRSRPQRQKATRPRHASAPVPTALPASTPARIRSALAESWRVFGTALLLASVLLLASAPIYLSETRSAARWQARLAALPSADAAHPPGTAAVLEGRIAPSTQPLFRHFAAYVRETHRGAGRGSSWWIVEDTAKAILTLDTATGPVQLADADYAFSPMQDPMLPFAPEWRDEIVRDWDHVSAREGAEPGQPPEKVRYRGLVPGEPVLAIGRTAAGGRFDADHVVAGDRQSLAAHLAHMASGAHDATRHGFMIAGLAAFALVLAGWLAYVVWTARDRNRH